MHHFPISEQRCDPMGEPDSTKGPAHDAATLREQWLRVLSELVELVRSWAEEDEWSTRRITKGMKDSRLGSYEAPGLLLQKDTARLLLDPVARFTPGADGVVDLYTMPAYDDIASLYLIAGTWHLRHEYPGRAGRKEDPDARPKPLTKKALKRVFDEMLTHAASA